MHELGVMYKVLDEVSEIANENHINHVTGIVLEVGELSSVIPFFLTEYFPVIIENKPLFEGCELIVEPVEGIGECTECGTQYNVVQCDGYCPKCHAGSKKILSGRDFIIKEIQIPDIGL